MSAEYPERRDVLVAPGLTRYSVGTLVVVHADGPTAQRPCVKLTVSHDSRVTVGASAGAGCCPYDAARSGRARPTGRHRDPSWRGRTATAGRQRFVRTPTNARRSPPNLGGRSRSQGVGSRGRRREVACPDSFRVNVLAAGGCFSQRWRI